MCSKSHARRGARACRSAGCADKPPEHLNLVTPTLEHWKTAPLVAQDLVVSPRITRVHGTTSE
jgi:hypothetical protein